MGASVAGFVKDVGSHGRTMDEITFPVENAPEGSFSARVWGTAQVYAISEKATPPSRSLAQGSRRR